MGRIASWQAICHINASSNHSVDYGSEYTACDSFALDAAEVNEVTVNRVGSIVTEQILVQENDGDSEVRSEDMIDEGSIVEDQTAAVVRSKRYKVSPWSRFSICHLIRILIALMSSSVRSCC